MKTRTPFVWTIGNQYSSQSKNKRKGTYDPMT